MAGRVEGEMLTEFRKSCYACKIFIYRRIQFQIEKRIEFVSVSVQYIGCLSVEKQIQWYADLRACLDSFKLQPKFSVQPDNVVG